MRRLYFVLLAVLGFVALTSCDDTESYADQKKRERAAIGQYIANNNISVISESTFKANGEVTDLNKNEFVLFEGSGVYMQIVRKGCGAKLQDGERVNVLCRFSEWNLLTDSLQLSNDVAYWSSVVDKMTVSNTSGTYTASFIEGASLMYSAYRSTSVPSGWLVPLAYINLGRPKSETDEIAKVRLIVPHTQGQQYASTNVYPCLYEITYERGR